MVGRNEPINELKAKAETLAMCLIKRSLNGMVDWIEPSRFGGAILVDEMNHANDALICMCDSAGSSPEDSGARHSTRDQVGD